MNLYAALYPPCPFSARALGVCRQDTSKLETELVAQHLNFRCQAQGVYDEPFTDFDHVVFAVSKPKP